MENLTPQQEDYLLELAQDLKADKGLTNSDTQTLERDMNGHCPHIHKDDPHWVICQDCWIKEHTKK